MRRHLIAISLTHILASACPFGAASQEVLLYSPAATVSRFEASAQQKDGAAWVRWQTTVELGVESFRVLRQRNGGELEPVGAGYVPSHGDETGDTYELMDPLVQAGETVRYELMLASRHGPDQKVADWTGVIKIAVPRPEPVLVSAQDKATDDSVRLVQGWIGSGARVLIWTNAAPADRVRLSLRDEGVYRVSDQELADASGWGLATVSNAIASTNLNLSCQGASVAWFAEGTNLFFHGRPTDSRFAPENVYWVSLGEGSRMATQVMTPGEPATTNDWFVNMITRQGTNYLTRVTHSTLVDVQAPYVAFNSLNASNRAQFVETLVDCITGDWTGLVTVNLLSEYNIGVDDHEAGVLIGRENAGSLTWSNEQYLSGTYSFSSTNLVSGMATLSVTNTSDNSGANSLFILVSYVFAYPAYYRAHQGSLRCTGGESNTVVVSGFATNDIMAWDVSVTNLPVAIEPVTMAYDTAASNWAAAFPCGGTGQIYQVFSKSLGTRLPAVRGVRDVDWSAAAEAADYVILVPPEAWRPDFRPALQPLADFRSAQGLKTVIVDVESLYNRYSYGLVDPLAIRAFCIEGYTNGTAHPLRYLLLAGAGALDFKHQRLSVNDYTACLIPPLIAGQRFEFSGEGMTVAIDGAFGDVNGDNIPEVAIGRLPTTKTQDLAVFAQKTMDYEGMLTWKQQASIAADWDNISNKYYQFSAATDCLVDPLSEADRNVVKHYITASSSGAVVRLNSLFPALSSGSGLFHFFGHTDEQNLGGGSSKLLRNADVAPANWQKPTIGIVIGCRPNRWQSLTATVCILPYGLFATNTGFVAALGATGYMLGSEGEPLAVSLYSNAAVQGTVRLGDVWRRGLQSQAGVMPAERLLCYSLIGDPALVFRHDVSAMGTPAAWLANYGMTAPNADLADPDLDGWPTWQEYQAQTGPTNCELQIKALPQERPGRYAISFETDSNRQYTVAFGTSLLDTNGWQASAWSWTNATEWTPPETFITPQGPVTTVEVPAPDTTTQSFYRVREMDAP